MKARYWFLLAILAAGVGIVGLRSNAQRASEMKQQIIQRDVTGAAVTANINELRRFVFKHMNSSVRLELTASYERAKAGAQAGGVTGQVYAQAQAACDRPGDSSVVQAACVQAYLARRSGGEGSQSPPAKSQFVYAFASPSWSPDLAGWGLLLSLGFFSGGVAAYVRSQFQNRPYKT